MTAHLSAGVVTDQHGEAWATLRPLCGSKMRDGDRIYFNPEADAAEVSCEACLSVGRA